MWHWWLQLDWPGRGVVVAMLVGALNLALGAYNAIRARGEDKRAAARARETRKTERIAARHAELRPLLRTQMTRLDDAASACSAVADAIDAGLRDFSCPPIPAADDVNQTVATLDEIRQRVDWEPQLVEAASSRLKSMKADYRSLATSFEAVKSAIARAHASYSEWYNVEFGGDVFIDPAMTWWPRSREQPESLKRTSDRDHEQMLASIQQFHGPVDSWRTSLERTRDSIAALIGAMDAFEREDEHHR